MHGTTLGNLKGRSRSRNIPAMAKLASKANVNGKLAELKAKHFSAENRDERIAKALALLDLPAPKITLDKETWKWAAENAEIEDI